MLELADIVRAAGEVYQRLHGPTLLPSHRRALHDIAACRTATLGGHVRACDHCGTREYSYHSCRNRHCPKCHGDQTRRWLDRQRARLLPCAYFLLTFTLPAELRALARAHQKLVYGVLMTAAAAALLKLTADPRYLGARPGVLAVLHTWTRALLYHPHVHMLVTAGGLRGPDRTWVPPTHAAFLVPGRALSRLFRAKVRAGLRKAGFLEHTPPAVWRHEWVVHVQHAGTGQKVLDYLARYVFRIALVNSRLERFEDGQVTFRYRDGRTGTIKRCTLDAVSFLGRFLQHVLPQGFSKVRHYGLFSPSRQDLLAQARAQLVAAATSPSPPALPPIDPTPVPTPANPASRRCPVCGIGVLHLVETLPPCGRSP
ncbi:MAG: IS91 family transposase [Candidatus Rokubacteria bacterium]|nr:IS91 family transposase [Candidatus Rokubacteria bacterium]